MQKLQKVEFANIVALDSDEHAVVFGILGGPLGKKLAGILWGVKPYPAERDEVEDKKPFWEPIIKLIKRAGDHSDDESHSKEIMGNVLTLRTILGRQLCFELKDKVLRVVVEQVDSEGKVVKSGVVASADREQHDKVITDLPYTISRPIAPAIRRLWKWSSKFSEGQLHYQGWGDDPEHWGISWKEIP